MKREFASDICEMVGREVRIDISRDRTVEGILIAVTKKCYVAYCSNNTIFVDRGPGITLTIVDEEEVDEEGSFVAVCSCGNDCGFAKEDVFGILLDDNTYVRCFRCGEKVDVTAQIPEDWRM